MRPPPNVPHPSKPHGECTAAARSLTGRCAGMVLLAIVVFVAAAPTARAQLAQIAGVTLDREGGSLVARAELMSTDRPIEAVDLLWVVSTNPLNGDALANLPISPDMLAHRWKRVRLADAFQDGTLEVGVLETAPIRSDEVLVHEVDGLRFVRSRLDSAAPGEPVPIAQPLPLIDQAPNAPLYLAASLLGYRAGTYTESDFDRLPREGAVGLSVLTRTIGLSGRGDLGGRADASDPDLPDALVKLVRGALFEDDDTVHPYGVAAALWLLPELTPEAFVAIAVDYLTGTSNHFHERFHAQLTADRTQQPLTYAVALDSVIPRPGPGRSTTRVMAMASYMMEPPWNARLSVALAGRAATPAPERLRRFFAQAGMGMLAGLDRWPHDLIEPALAALARWSVGDALIILFGWRSQPAFETAMAAVGRDKLVRLGADMVRGGVPTPVLDALGSPLTAQREVARDLLIAAGSHAVEPVRAYLRRLGHSNRADGDITTVVSRLQGVLLGDLARPFHDEAWRIHLHGGDCVDALERARREIHPDLLLPEPLYARCRALRATHLLEQPGGLDRAEALINEAIRDAPNDPKVQERRIKIGMARANQLLDAGEVYDAQALVESLDPDQDDAGTLSVRAAIQTRLGYLALEEDDRAGAARYFAEARRLNPNLPPPSALLADAGGPVRKVLYAMVSVLMTAGLAALLLLWVMRIRAASDFELDSREHPKVLKGPGGRRLLLAPHGILAMRPFSYQLVSWADVERAYLLTGTSDLSGLLLWQRGGDAFVVPTPAVHRFDLFVDLVSGYLESAGVPLVITRPMNDDVVLQNEAAVTALSRLDRFNRYLNRAALASAGVIGYGLVVYDPGAGLDLLGRLPVALGITIGLGMLLSAGVQMIVPPARA